MSESKRLAFFLPNIFTALNIACGYASVMLSFKGKYYEAAMVLVLGAIFDSVDGRVARMTGTQSNFGEQFDSISDVVSFGFAPAVLFYKCFLEGLGRVGLVVSFVYLLCGALRLARFNANIDKVSSNYFQGIPIPLAALSVIGYTLISIEIPALRELPVVSIIYLLFFALLMISNIPFWSFKDSTWVRKHKKRVLALVFLLFSLIAIYEEIMIVVIVLLYTCISIIYYSLNKGKMTDIFAWKGEEDEE